MILLFIKDLILGAVSLEITEAGIQPWRLPYKKIHRFAAPLVEKGIETAGIRLGMITDSNFIEVSFKPSEEVMVFDLVIDGEQRHSCRVEAGERTCLFQNLTVGLNSMIEIYLPQGQPILLKDINVKKGARVRHRHGQLL